MFGRISTNKCNEYEVSSSMTSMGNPIDFAVSGRDSETLDMVSEAVKHGQAMLAYQPVVRSDPGHQIAFFEGLIRVTDSTGRVIPARDFMPVVENRELGREIDTLTLRLGLEALRMVPGLRLSLNMSARSIGYAPWLEELEVSLKRDDTIGTRLILEISEGSAMLVPELVVDFMDRLQSKGIAFALDNFGSGYTALRYFKDFFFDIIKLDGQFIRNIADDPDNQILTEALATIGKQFDMLVVAEMVERPEDVDVLRRLGVECLQGFVFGAPTTRPDFLNGRSSRAS